MLAEVKEGRTVRVRGRSRSEVEEEQEEEVEGRVGGGKHSAELRAAVLVLDSWCGERVTQRGLMADL